MKAATIPLEIKGIEVYHITTRPFFPNTVLIYYSSKIVKSSLKSRRLNDKELEIKEIIGESALKKFIEKFNILGVKKRIESNKMPEHSVKCGDGDTVWINAFDEYGNLNLTYWAEVDDGICIGNLNITGKELHNILCANNKYYERVNSWVNGAFKYAIAIIFVLIVMTLLEKFL